MRKRRLTPQSADMQRTGQPWQAGYWREKGDTKAEKRKILFRMTLSDHTVQGGIDSFHLSLHIGNASVFSIPLWLPYGGKYLSESSTCLHLFQTRSRNGRGGGNFRSIYFSSFVRDLNMHSLTLAVALLTSLLWLRGPKPIYSVLVLSWRMRTVLMPSNSWLRTPMYVRSTFWLCICLSNVSICMILGKNTYVTGTYPQVLSHTCMYRYMYHKNIHAGFWRRPHIFYMAAWLSDCSCNCFSILSPPLKPERMAGDATFPWGANLHMKAWDSWMILTREGFQCPFGARRAGVWRGNFLLCCQGFSGLVHNNLSCSIVVVTVYSCFFSHTYKNKLNHLPCTCTNHVIKICKKMYSKVYSIH